MSKSLQLRAQSIGEEIANASSHGVGTLLAIAATVVAIVLAALTSDVMSVVAVSLYGASLIILYTFSSLYHSITNRKAKFVLQVFDHCSIFILILGTYIPICFNILRGTTGWILFGINAFCTIIGVTLNAVNLEKWKKISIVLYVIMGWSIIFSMKYVVTKIPFEGLVFLVGGGISYTVGIVFYKLKNVKYMHFVWHLFVLCGSILHYFFIILYSL